MMDRKDYDALTAKRAEQQAPESMAQLRIKQVGAELANKLSSDPAWGKFQQEAANKLVAARAAVSAYQSVLLDPTTVDAERLTRAKIGMHAHQAIVDAYTDMLDFPNREKSAVKVDAE